MSSNNDGKMPESQDISEIDVNEEEEDANESENNQSHSSKANNSEDKGNVADFNEENISERIEIEGSDDVGSDNFGSDDGSPKSQEINEATSDEAQISGSDERNEVESSSKDKRYDGNRSESHASSHESSHESSYDTNKDDNHDGNMTIEIEMVKIEPFPLIYQKGNRHVFVALKWQGEMPYTSTKHLEKGTEKVEEQVIIEKEEDHETEQ